MASHGYQDFNNNLGISTVNVSFSFCGSLICFVLSPTNVIPVQAVGKWKIYIKFSREKTRELSTFQLILIFSTEFCVYWPVALKIVPTATMTRSWRIFFTASAWYLLLDSTKRGWLLAWFHMPRVLLNNFKHFTAASISKRH